MGSYIRNMKNTANFLISSGFKLDILQLSNVLFCFLKLCCMLNNDLKSLTFILISQCSI